MDAALGVHLALQNPVHALAVLVPVEAVVADRGGELPGGDGGERAVGRADGAGALAVEEEQLVERDVDRRFHAPAEVAER